MRYPELVKKQKEEKLSYEDMAQLSGVHTDRLKKCLTGHGVFTDKELSALNIFCFPESSFDELKRGAKSLRKAS